MYNISFMVFRSLMVANVELELRDRSSIPIVFQIMDDGLRQVVYIVLTQRRWLPPGSAIRYWGGLRHSSINQLVTHA